MKDNEYYKNLDKRSKEYRDYKKANKGLGDKVEKVLNSKPLKPITNALKSLIWKDGEDCGCDTRRERLNKLGKWFAQTHVKCLTEDEYQWLDEYFTNKTGHVIHSQTQYMLLKIFNRVFTQQRKPSNCSPCVKELVDKLELLYNNYDFSK